MLPFYELEFLINLSLMFNMAVYLLLKGNSKSRFLINPSENSQFIVEILIRISQTHDYISDEI